MSVSIYGIVMTKAVKSVTEKNQFIRINSDFIALKNGCDINNIGVVGLYGVISAFLSNPDFKTSYGGFKEAVLKHCSNGRYSFCAYWNTLKSSGFLKRTRIPEGPHCFHDYYRLLNAADSSLPEVCNLGYSQGREFLKSITPFRAPHGNYTEVSYKMLMDSTLSLTAKGLYAAIKRLLDLAAAGTDVVICKDTVRKNVKMGFRSFNTAWSELKKSGYLKITRVWSFEINQISYIYSLEDANLTAVSEKPTKNRAPKRIKERKLPVIKPPIQKPDEDILEKIKWNIEYDVILEKPVVKDYANTVFDVLVNTLSLPDNQKIRFGDGMIDTKQAKERILNLNHEEFELVCLNYHEALTRESKIYNPASYIRRLLLNAHQDMIYFEQKLNAAFAKQTFKNA